MVTFCGTNLGLTAQYFSICYLLVSWTMALLCAGIDSGVIKLIKHWRSDKVIHYLHVQVVPVMNFFSSFMVKYGTYW